MIQMVSFRISIHGVKNECARIRVGATLVALMEAKASPTQEFGCAIIYVALYNFDNSSLFGIGPACAKLLRRRQALGIGPQ